MIIYGRSNLEHDKHLINFLEACRKNTLTLNPEKIDKWGFGYLLGGL